jgi:DNA replication protein DnaC
VDDFPELKPTICDDCNKKRETKLAEEFTARLEQRWRSMCPCIYQDTDLNHPAMPKGEKVQKILNWRPGGKGLLLFGPTRKGKTRLAWMLLRNLFFLGYSVLPLTAADFADAICQNATDLSEWRNWHMTHDIVFLDDLGKCKLTDRVEAELFDLIDRRSARSRGTVVTTNLSGDPLVERLREFFIAISFN